MSLTWRALSSHRDEVPCDVLDQSFHDGFHVRPQGALPRSFGNGLRDGVSHLPPQIIETLGKILCCLHKTYRTLWCLVPTSAHIQNLLFLSFTKAVERYGLHAGVSHLTPQIIETLGDFCFVLFM